MTSIVEQPLPMDGPSARMPGALWLLTVLILLYALSFLDRFIISLMVDPIKRDLQISDSAIGLLQGASFALFYAVMGLPFGWAADRKPRRTVIFVGVMIWAVCASACGFASYYWQLMLARFGVGAGEAALAPSGYSMLTDSFPRNRLAFVSSLFASGAMIGSGLALIGGGQLLRLLPQAGVDVPVLGHFAVWQLVFVITGLPGLMLAVLIFTTREPPRRVAIGKSLATWSDTLRFMRQNRRFYAGHFVGFGLYSMCGYGSSAWMPTYLIRVLKNDVGTVALVVGAITLTSGLVGTLTAGAFVDRLFSRGMRDAHLRVSAVCGFLQMLLMVLAMQIGSLWPLIACLAAVHLFNGYAGVASSALQIVTPPEFRGRVTAIYLFVFTVIGAGFGPSITALFTDLVFRDDMKVHHAIAMTYLVFMPMAVLALMWAARGQRRASGLNSPSGTTMAS